MSTASARPLVSVFSTAGVKTGDAPLPAVFLSPLRPDLIQFVHTNMNKNNRQAYAVNMDAGHQTSATSWGTGRAVARIPRVGGGGTQRSGQAAFGNMCRAGRMFAPTKTWRKWARKINGTQKRYAVASALAGSAVSALVMARGHSVDNVPEVPLVVGGNFEQINKAADAKAFLEKVGADDDVERASASKKVRTGKGKSRNRRYTMRKGPLIIYSSNDGVEQGFRNFPGVELCNVDRLNLLQLAPGGHMGRFVIYSEKAMSKLDAMYGSGAGQKALPNAAMNNADLARLINSDEIQSIVNPAKAKDTQFLRKKNAITSIKALAKISPYAAQARASETKAQADRAAGKGKKVAKKAKTDKKIKSAGKAYYKKIVAQGSVCENGFTE